MVRRERLQTQARQGAAINNVSDHPVRAFTRMPSAIFFDGASTPPLEEGITNRIQRSISNLGNTPYEARVHSARKWGNKITSRMDVEFVSSMVNRSTPIPSPAVGGIP